MRLESLAEPGGILVSGNCYDYVRNKVNVGFDDIGAQLEKYRRSGAGLPRSGAPTVAIPQTKPDRQAFNRRIAL